MTAAYSVVRVSDYNQSDNGCPDHAPRKGVEDKAGYEHGKDGGAEYWRITNTDSSFFIFFTIIPKIDLQSVQFFAYVGYWHGVFRTFVTKLNKATSIQ